MQPEYSSFQDDLSTTTGIAESQLGSGPEVVEFQRDRLQHTRRCSRSVADGDPRSDLGGLSTVHISSRLSAVAEQFTPSGYVQPGI